MTQANRRLALQKNGLGQGIGASTIEFGRNTHSLSYRPPPDITTKVNVLFGEGLGEELGLTIGAQQQQALIVKSWMDPCYHARLRFKTPALIPILGALPRVAVSCTPQHPHTHVGIRPRGHPTYL